MKVTCSECQAEYTLDSSKIPDTGNPFITCKSCKNKIRLTSSIPLGGSEDLGDTASPNLEKIDEDPFTTLTLDLDDDDIIPLGPVTDLAPGPRRPTQEIEIEKIAVPSSLSPMPVPIPEDMPLPPPPPGTMLEESSALSDSDATTTETLSDSVATPPSPPADSPIPLTSDAPVLPPPPPDESAVPLASEVLPPAPPADSAIPLTSDASILPPLPPDEPGIPLASDSSILPPPPPDEPGIPLDPTILPPPPVIADGLPPDDDGDLPAALDSSPAADVDGLFDLPDAVLPAPPDESINPGTVEVPDLSPLPEAPSTPAFLDDLPIAAEPDDLPIAAPALELDLNPTAPSVELDDLPAQVSVDAPSLMDALSTDAVSLADLPTMDTSDDPFANTGDFGDPSLSDSHDPSDAPKVTSTPVGKAQKKKGGPRVLLLMGVALLLLMASGAVAFFMYRETLMGMVATGLSPEPSTPDEISPAKTVGPSGEPKTVEGPKTTNDATPVPSDTLTEANVDGLDYPSLKRLTEPPQGADEGAMLWALYRRAAEFGDTQAQDILVEKAPRRPDTSSLSPMGKAAAVGALMLQGKKGPARKLAEKLRQRDKDSAHIAYVAGLTALPNTRKAVRGFEQAMDRDHDWPLPRLQLGLLELASKRPQERTAGLEELKKLLAKTGAAQPRFIDKLSIATALAAAGEYNLLPELTLHFQDQLPTLPKEKAALAQRFVLAQQLLQGKLEEARISLVEAGAEPYNRLRLLQAIILSAPKTKESTKKQIIDLLATVAGNESLDQDVLVNMLVARLEWLFAHAQVDEAKSVVEQLQQLKNIAPRIVAGWRTYAEALVLMSEDKTRLAQASFAAAYRKPPRPTAARLAQVLADTPSPTRLRRLEQIVKLDDVPRARLALARALMLNDRAVEALPHFEAAFWRDPLADDPVVVLLDWFEAMQRAQQSEMAFKHATALSEALSDDKRPVERLVAMAIREGDAEKLKHWFQQLMVHDPDDPDHHIRLAAELINLKKYADARAVLEPMLKQEDLEKDHELQFQWARAWSLEDPIKARGILIELRAQNPTARLHMLLGVIDQKRTKNDTALESFKDAYKLDPTLYEAHFRAAQIDAANGANESAEKELKLVLDHAADDTAALTLLGDVYCAMDRWRECARTYQRSVVAGDTSAEILLKLGKTQIHHLNQLRPGVRSLQRSVESNPKNAEAFYLLGYALKDIGRRADARKNLETYLDLESDNVLAEEVRELLKTL